MRRYIVTGCAGFIGSHVVKALLERGEEVVGIDAFTDFYARDLKDANVASFRDHRRFQLVTADLSDDRIDTYVADGAGVFHLAAQPGVRGSWGETFDVYARDNVLATQRVLESAMRAGTRVVFASSSSVYGNATGYPTSEDARPDPISPYGVTKLSCENLARAYTSSFGLHIVSLRYFTVYGPRQRPDMAFMRMIDALVNGDEFPVFGSGMQSRDFTYIDDAVSATLLAMEKGPAGAVYNVGGGSETSLLDAIRVVESLGGGHLRTRALDPAAGDVRRTAADTQRIKDDLGWFPQVALVDGLEAQLRWASARSGGARETAAP
jgi:UDP-glucuronate 4-epimerase